MREPLAINFASKQVSAWRLASDDRRFGGLSALAVTREGFLALTDTGRIVRFANGSRSVIVGDLPSGPGDPRFKRHRDSEALAPDPGGRGWWVAFENGHQLRLFDPAFRRTLDVVDLSGFGWPSNKGVEGLAAAGGALFLFPESGDQVLRLAGGRLAAAPLARPFGRISDATPLDPERILVLQRTITPFGFRARLAIYRIADGQWRDFGALPIGRLDNPEGIARAGDNIWVVTDNDFRRRVPTLLIRLPVAD